MARMKQFIAAGVDLMFRNSEKILFRNRLFDDGPRINHAEHLAQAMATGIQIPLLELYHD